MGSGAAAGAGEGLALASATGIASVSVQPQTVQTRFGPVRVKTAQGYGVTREKAEYDDLARRARESGQPLDEIRAAVAQALRDRNETE